MNIYYSRHAKRRMKWRRITESDIRSALELPDALEKVSEDRYNALKRIELRLLKVTFTRVDETYVVITAVWKGE